jgi:hypothetical protein
MAASLHEKLIKVGAKVSHGRYGRDITALIACGRRPRRREWR